MQRLRSQIEQLQSELLYFRGDSNAPTEELKILKHKVSLLEASKAELQEALQECRISYEHLKQRAIDAQVEKDRLVILVESIRNGNPIDEFNDKSDKDFDLVKSYVTKIQKLESELVRLRSSSHLRHGNSDDFLYSEDDGTHSRNLFMDVDIRSEETDVVVEDVEKELEHSSIQEQLDRELQELDKKLEQKEAEMKRFASGDTSVLKQHYEKKVHELENEIWTQQKEIEELRSKHENIEPNSDDSAQKLKEEYLQKLNFLEKQVAELKKKHDAQNQLLRQKQKSDEAAKKLNDEIQRIKTHKVQLQHKIKQESEQFRQWKASREKEVLQLKKEGRRNEYEMHKLLALNQRQKLVLLRKTEEAANATKRLKELLDSRKASSRETSGVGSNKGPGIPVLVQTIEHELEVTIGVHEVRSEYERQMKERARMAEELARLKEEALIEKQQNFSEFPEAMSPGARNSRIFALENMLATSSSTLVSMASQLSEAEERERAFSGRGRWNQVRSLAEAKNVMNFLFNLASSSRCQLRDREVDCREKDSEIRDLKEKVVNLVSQLELKKAEFSRQENLMMLSLERLSNRDGGSGNMTSNSDKHVYDLWPKGSGSSTVLSSGAYDLELLEDMDTSDDEQPNVENDEDGEWVQTRERKRRQSKRRNSKMVDLGVCCTCSRYSSCKTSRCECRAANGSCSSSCSCRTNRCSNREASMKDMLDLSENMSLQEEAETSHDLAAHGAMLLGSALSGKPANQSTDGTVRKPLSDIGNNLGLSSVPKPVLRKKWRKSAIQLVPATPPVSHPQNGEGPVQPKASGENEIPLKLPRAMRSTLTNNNQLKQRNIEQSSELVETDICTSSSLGSPRNGKENKGM
ncbi:hypothetical protein SASPL_147219 [Salvia splendens]|uniref:Kinesin family member 4/7/21/27 n=2 Tax=Salvia splendens TaxID=180675 RepID=A0A8X8WES4_SALSN|nr:hypothetical protein SASPL_147219 [Salvia splendens]